MKAAERTLQIRALLRRLRRSEEGFTLVMALGFVVVLGITATTTITYATQNERSSQLQKADQLALSYAEAALARAYSTVYAASDPRDPSGVPERTVAYERGTGTYSGVLTNGSNWALVGIGRVANPANGNDIVRTVRGRTSVGSGTRGSSNNAVWNYIYVDDPDGCTRLGNSVEINIPLYIRGNLCLANNSAIVASAYTLQVDGWVQFENSGTIGTSAARLHEAHISGGCRIGSSGPFLSPCGDATRVYTEIPPDTQTTGLIKPPLELPRWYQDSKPGPMHDCNGGSPRPPVPAGYATWFDRDTTLNHNRASIDLAPDYAYDCQYWENGELVGQIKWTPGAPGTLVIKGTVFFDGDIVFRNQTQVVYQGRGSIYSSGRVTMGNQTMICGVATCDAAWEPLEDLLAFVAGGMDGGDTSFEVAQYTRFQGAIYAEHAYREENGATVWGPIIADEIYLANSSTNFYVPIGTLLPGMPAQYDEVVVLSNEPGSWG